MSAQDHEPEVEHQDKQEPAHSQVHKEVHKIENGKDEIVEEEDVSFDPPPPIVRSRDR